VIAGIVLAAGSGTRIGHPKALLIHTGGECFLTRACDLLRQAGVDEVTAVVTSGIARTAERLGKAARLLINDEPEQGQLSSLQVALAALGPSTEAAVVLPVDVPLVQVRTVRALIAAWSLTHPPVLRPSKGERHGHPVVFDRAVFDELMAADPKAGAKEVVRRYSAHGDVPVDDEGAFVDVDTEEDYVAAFGRLPQAVPIQ
jgi:CTP:molybdopterin cytidylyltransferase MocA